MAEANEHIAAGRLPEAAASAETMLALEREWLGEDSVEVFSSLNWLVEIYAEADDVPKCTAWARQALVWAEAHLGADHWQTASAREEVKRLELIAGLDERRQELLVDASAAASLCDEQLENEEYEAALASAELAASRVRDVYGDSHLEVAAALHLVAEAQAGLGDYDAADAALRGALAIDDAILGAAHPHVGDDRYALGRVLYDNEQYAAAREQFQAAVEIYDGAEQIADAAWSHSWIGDCWYAEGDSDAAIAAYALAFARNAREELPEQRAELLKSLATIYAELENHAAALPLLEESAALHLDLDGEASADYLTLLDSVAEACRLTGDFARAVALHEQVLAARANVLGEKSLDYSTSLNNLGLAYAALGRCDDATRVLQQAVDLRKELLGEEHEWHALSLLNLAEAHTVCGQYQTAKPFAEQAREIFTTGLGPRHAHTVASMNNLALIVENMGDYAGAESLLAEALSIRRETLGVPKTYLAISLSNLAVLLQKLGDYARAEELHLEANAIRREAMGEDHPAYATGLNNLGLLYSDMGDFPRAEPLLKRAAEIRRRALGETHMDYAVSLSNLGRLYQRMGDLERAKEATLAAMAILEEQVDEHHPYRAVVANNLAWMYENTGERGKAAPLYLQAIEIERRSLGERHPEYAASLLNLASLYQGRGDYALAAPLYEQVLDIRRATVGERHPHDAIALNNLAMMHMGMGEFDRAEQLAHQAREIDREVFGALHPDGANLLNNLASVSQFRGDHAAAGPLIREALDAIEHMAATAVISTEQDQITLAHAQRFSLDNYLSSLLEIGDSADDAYRAVLNWKGATLVRQRAAREASEEEDLAPLFAELQSVVRRCSTLVRTPPASLADWRQQVDELTQRKDAIEAQLSARSAAYREASDRVTLEELQAALPQDAALVDYLEFDRSTIVEDPVRGGVGVILSPGEENPSINRIVPSGAAAAAGELQVGDLVLAVAADGATWQSVAGWDLPRVVAQIGGEAGAVVRLRVKREGRDEPLEIAVTRAPLPLQRKFRRTTQRRLAAFVVRPGREVGWFDMGPAAPVTEAIDLWRESKGRASEAASAGEQLREMVWQPLLAALGDAKTILVSPDGALGRFPLAALPGREPGTYLIEDQALALVPVAQLIPALVADAAPRKLPKDLLLLGEVDYNNRETSAATSANPAPRRRLPSERSSDVRALVGDHQWVQLVGARDEAAVIRDLYRQLVELPPDRIADLHGAEATEQRFRELAPQCYQLHIATHGFFADAENMSAESENATASAAGRAAATGLLGGRREEVWGFSPGLLSGLVLAGANKPPDLSEMAPGGEPPEDGILTADEIALMPLTGVRLAVLSACETGLGESAGGEGLLGIQRAFQVAGVRATIATLWKVNDLATRRIMEQFYRNYLEKEMSPLEALRTAQIWALRNPGLVPRGANAPAGDAAALPPEFWAAFILSGDWR